MSFRNERKPYGGHPSWRHWRNANAQTLADAGVPPFAHDSSTNWAFFLQEADVTLIGGPPFCLDDLHVGQIRLLHALLLTIPDHSQGGDLLAAVVRLLARLDSR